MLEFEQQSISMKETESDFNAIAWIILLNGIFRCSKCNRVVICEERKTHSCKKLFDYKFDDDLIWVNDSECWYPLKWRAPNFKTLNGTPREKTEPNLLKNNKSKTIRY